MFRCDVLEILSCRTPPSSIVIIEHLVMVKVGASFCTECTLCTCTVYTIDMPLLNDMQILILLWILVVVGDGGLRDGGL